MSDLSKIIRKVSDKGKVQSTPFLNFEYDGYSVFEEKPEEKIKTYSVHLQGVLERNQKLNEEKDSINGKALKERLSEAESRRLSSIFNLIERNRQEASSLQGEIEKLSRKSSESFFDK